MLSKKWEIGVDLRYIIRTNEDKTLSPDGQSVIIQVQKLVLIKSNWGTHMEQVSILQNTLVLDTVGLMQMLTLDFLHILLKHISL